MASILRYVLSDREGNEEDYEYDDYREAQAFARQRGMAVIEHEYEWTDSSLAWTPDGSDTWPPVVER